MSLEHVDSEFGTTLKSVRRERDLSQDELATRVSALGYPMSQATIGKIERGERRVTVGEAVTLANVLGYTLDGLVGGGGDLVTFYQLFDYTQSLHRRQSQDYLRAMMNVAIAADELGDQLRPEDRQWLLKNLPKQTPAMLIEARLHADGRLSRDGISEPGEYLKVLLEALYRDEDALRAALGDDDG